MADNANTSGDAEQLLEHMREELLALEALFKRFGNTDSESKVQLLWLSKPHLLRITEIVVELAAVDGPLALPDSQFQAEFQQALREMADSLSGTFE